ncbi:hypothetical protein ACLOJK_041392 [Asimina triloba]
MGDWASREDGRTSKKGRSGAASRVEIGMDSRIRRRRSRSISPRQSRRWEENEEEKEDRRRLTGRKKIQGEGVDREEEGIQGSKGSTARRGEWCKAGKQGVDGETRQGSARQGIDDEARRGKAARGRGSMTRRGEAEDRWREK